MNTNGENGYLKCRKIACLTQELAAEILEVSVRQLSNYENYHASIGTGLPPDHVVLKMAQCYNTPWLIVDHLRETNILFRSVFKHKHHIDNLALAIMVSQKEMDDIDRAEPQMINALLDGRIDPEEEPAVDRYFDELWDFIDIALNILTNKKIKKHPLRTDAIQNY